MWKSKGNGIPKTIWEKSKMGGIFSPNFKTYYGATVFKIAWHQWRDIRIDHWHRIKKPEIDLPQIRQTDFWKQCKRDSVEEMAFSTNGARTSERLSINKNINFEVNLTSPTKINSNASLI